MTALWDDLFQDASELFLDVFGEEEPLNVTLPGEDPLEVRGVLTEIEDPMELESGGFAFRKIKVFQVRVQDVSDLPAGTMIQQADGLVFEIAPPASVKDGWATYKLREPDHA